MLALNMKAKSTKTCKTDKSYPHVSQKSSKISKMPCSVVRVIHESADLNTPIQMPKNGFKNEVTTKENENDKIQMSFNGHKIAVQTCLSLDDDSDSIKKRDSSPVYLSSLETMSSPFTGSNDGHCNLFDAVDREQIALVPQVDDNSSNYQISHMLDTYIYEMYLTGFSTDRRNVFDDNVNYNTLFDLEFDGTNLIDVTEGFMSSPSHEETVEGTDFNYRGFCEDFQQVSDYSWFYHMGHQTKPFNQEFDVGHSPFDSEEADYSDPESFIRNFPELSDQYYSLPPLVSKETNKRKHITLVLDLDETLVHSTMEPCDGADFTIQVFFDKKEHTVYVRQRPFLQAFLDRVSEMFEIIIFTASQSIYAEKLLDVLDPHRKLFSRRVYRESCIFSDGSYTKDLTVLGIDLSKVVIVDNSPQVFRLQADNGIPIKSWFDDPSDSALISLLPFLETLVDVDDVRPIIAKKFGVRD